VSKRTKRKGTTGKQKHTGTVEYSLIVNYGEESREKIEGGGRAVSRMRHDTRIMASFFLSRQRLFSRQSFDQPGRAHTLAPNDRCPPAAPCRVIVRNANTKQKKNPQPRGILCQGMFPSAAWLPCVFSPTSPFVLGQWDVCVGVKPICNHQRW
jgi:hypothetical protein